MEEKVLLSIGCKIRFAVILVMSTPLLGFASEDRNDYCKEQSELAGAMMAARQSGTLMADAMDAAGDNKALQAYVLISYDMPVYPTQEEKAKAVIMLENEIFGRCFKKQSGID